MNTSLWCSRNSHTRATRVGCRPVEHSMDPQSVGAAGRVWAQQPLVQPHPPRHKTESSECWSPNLSCGNMYQFPWFQVERRLTNLGVCCCCIFKGPLLHPIIQGVTLFPLLVHPSHHTGGRKTLSSMGGNLSKVFLKRSPEGHYWANFQDRVRQHAPGSY